MIYDRVGDFFERLEMIPYTADDIAKLFIKGDFNILDDGMIRVEGYTAEISCIAKDLRVDGVMIGVARRGRFWRVYDLESGRAIEPSSIKHETRRDAIEGFLAWYEAYSRYIVNKAKGDPERWQISL